MKRAVLFLFLGAGVVGPSGADKGVSISTSVFITSDTMEVVQQGLQTKFTSHVKVTQPGERLLCDELISDKSHHVLHAKGHVSLYKEVENEQVWEAFGQRGDYDTRENLMTLWNSHGRARLIKHHRSSELNTMELESEWMNTDNHFSFAHAKGRVYGRSVSTSTPQSIRFWSDEAVFDEPRSLIRLEGTRPVVILDQPSESRHITGRSIRYRIDDQKLEVEGDAVSKIFPGKPLLR